MARHDVHAAPSNGYLLVVQSDLLEELNTRVVVPLIPRDTAPTPARRLNPVFDIDGTSHVMVTQFMAAVPVSILGSPVGNLGAQADDITQAIDMLMQGF